MGFQIAGALTALCINLIEPFFKLLYGSTDYLCQASHQDKRGLAHDNSHVPRHQPFISAMKVKADIHDAGGEDQISESKYPKRVSFRGHGVSLTCIVTGSSNNIRNVIGHREYGSSGKCSHVVSVVVQKRTF
jgi:hypothetical protein